MHFGTGMKDLGFGVKRSTLKVINIITNILELVTIKNFLIVNFLKIND